jgi:hypothetical protein
MTTWRSHAASRLGIGFLHGFGGGLHGAVYQLRPTWTSPAY